MSQPEELDVLAALGCAVFERNPEGAFQICGEPPKWFSAIPDTSRLQSNLADVFPFLEVFLPDAEEFWTDSGEQHSLRSDYWIQRDREGSERHFRATAILLKRGV